MSPTRKPSEGLVTIKQNVPLAPYTTMGVGGPAEFLALCSSAQELVQAVGWAMEHGLPWYVLGGGSNVLVSDEGVEGLVAIYREAVPRYSVVRLEGDEALVSCPGGAPLAALAVSLARDGLSGLEWACGIPGTVAGAIAGNAGAHGMSMADILASCTAVRAGAQEQLSPAELGFSYRQCSACEDSKLIIEEAKLRMRLDHPSTCEERVLAYRQARRLQPRLPSAGCVFRNPPQAQAGLLLERAGLKGVRVGGARFAPEHANFIVNLGGATASDVIELMKMGRRLVFEMFGILLEPEVRFLGALTLEGT